MRFPGEILVQHKWICLVAIIVVIVGIFAGANENTYQYYKDRSPQISWDNIPQSAVVLFIWNLASALTALLIFPLLLLLVARIFIVPGGFGLGVSIGISLWLISQNPSNIAIFSHGILEIYSAFLAMVGGFLILVKIGEALWGFFGKMTPHYVDWNEVAREYGCLFLFSIIGLFISAWMEAFLGYAIRFGSSAWLVAIVNTCISVIIVSGFSFETVRTLVARKTMLFDSARLTKKKNAEIASYPEGVWCICPNCGAYISADITYCPCGTKLPKKRSKT